MCRATHTVSLLPAAEGCHVCQQKLPPFEDDKQQCSSSRPAQCCSDYLARNKLEGLLLLCAHTHTTHTLQCSSLPLITVRLRLGSQGLTPR